MIWCYAFFSWLGRCGKGGFSGSHPWDFLWRRHKCKEISLCFVPFFPSVFRRRRRRRGKEGKLCICMVIYNLALLSLHSTLLILSCMGGECITSVKEGAQVSFRLNVLALKRPYALKLRRSSIWQRVSSCRFIFPTHVVLSSCSNSSIHSARKLKQTLLRRESRSCRWVISCKLHSLWIAETDKVYV